MENFEITSGPLPGSEKIYVTGSRSDIRVPMRKIKLSPTVDLDGSKIENEDVVVYDTSGPYTDTNYTVDLQKGLPKLRENWIEERQDTVKLEGLSSEYCSRICPAGSGCRQGHYSGQHQSSGMRADDYRPELSGKNQCQYR